MDDLNIQSSSSTNAPADSTAQQSASSSSVTSCSNKAKHTTGQHSSVKPCYAQPGPHGFAGSVIEASSTSNASTLVNDELNQAMAETWSAPTHAGSEPEADQPCFLLVESNNITNSVADPLLEYQPCRQEGEFVNEMIRGLAYTLGGGPQETPERSVGLPASHTPASLDVRESRSTRSLTLVNGTLDDRIAESWYGPTCAGSIFETTLADFYGGDMHEEVAIHETAITIPKTRLEPLSIDRKQLTPANGFTQSPLASSDQKLSSFRQGTHIRDLSDVHRIAETEAIRRFSTQDPSEAPWTIYHLRTPGTVCAFCSSSFTGPDHKQKSIDHVREMHLTPQGFATASKIRPIIRPKRFYTPSHGATNRNSVATSWISEFMSRTPSRPIGYSWRLAEDFLAIGSRWEDELSFKTTTNRNLPTADRLLRNFQSNRIRDYQGLLTEVLALLNASRPSITPERWNDFFNGFDLVTRDLLHKFPKDATTRSMQSALDSLQLSAVVNLSGQTAEASTFVAAATGVTKCPTSHYENYASSAKGASRGTSGEPNFISNVRGSGNSTGHTCDDPDNIGRGPGVCARKQQTRPKHRKLACPLKKHDEIHGRHPSCNYDGAPNMSALRLHLKNRNHSDEDVPFIGFCGTCKDYVVSASGWYNLHITGQCIPTSETRKQTRGGSKVGGSKVGAQWLRLYDGICPQSERHPSPYVDDSTWIWKTSARNTGGLESVPHVGNLNFNFNDPPNVQHVSPPGLNQAYNGAPTPEVGPSPASGDAFQIGHLAIFEPIPTDPRYQGFTFTTSTPNNNKSFLEEAPAAVSNEPPLLQGRFLDHGVETIAADSTPVTAQDNTFDSYFSDILVDGYEIELDTAVSQSGDAPLATSPPQSGPCLIDAGHIAKLLFIVEQMEDYEQQPDVDNQMILVQGITQANSLSREELDTLTAKAKARIDALAERLHSRADPMTHGNSVTVADTFNMSDGFPPMSFEANPRHEYQPLLTLRGLDETSQDTSVPTLFAEFDMEDQELQSAGWNLPSPDPTARTFFPEIDLAAV